MDRREYVAYTKQNLDTLNKWLDYKYETIKESMVEATPMEAVAHQAVAKWLNQQLRALDAFRRESASEQRGNPPEGTKPGELTEDSLI